MAHFDLYITDESTGRRLILLFNGVEIFNVVDTSAGLVHDGYLALGANNAAGTMTVRRVVLASATNAIAAGAFDTTAEAPEQTFNGDTQLDAINWYADYLGWEYRIDYRPGKGNDLFNFGVAP